MSEMGDYRPYVTETEKFDRWLIKRLATERHLDPRDFLGLVIDAGLAALDNCSYDTTNGDKTHQNGGGNRVESER